MGRGGSGHSTQHPSFPRAACKQQAVTFTLLEDGASLTLSGGPLALDLNLSKVPGPEAASRLQALTLGLAERICSLERQLTGEVEGGAPRSLTRVPLPEPPFLAVFPSCRGDSCQPQEEPSADGASAVLTR